MANKNKNMYVQKKNFLPHNQLKCFILTTSISAKNINLKIKQGESRIQTFYFSFIYLRRVILKQISA